ncbi:MAG: hypothetical protein QOK16_1430 [Solirubrobacteraceae bacterium]|jgi:hypothetical protein|nr:hypothetical protein [Solirubrobacteraceae bacterium]MEA2186419.1 hypothetical protein [Solirubrobacteraceae bacterium]
MATDLRTLELTVNFRSLQRICDIAHQFTKPAAPDIAEGPNAACEIAAPDLPRSKR